MLFTPDPLTQVERSTERKNMRLLIQLRWLAVIGQVLAISLVHSGLEVPLPLLPMVAVIVGLILTNLGYMFWLQWRPAMETPAVLFFALLVDVLALAVQIYLSGGAGNPFIYLFLLQVILATVLLKPDHAWSIVAITVVCVVLLTMFHRPLAISMAGNGSFFNLYMLGVLICFLITTVLVVVFITQIVSNLRERDSSLADMRQRASEEEHIVRMGLLATGAAHELGTPLATLSVILGDWNRMPQVRDDPELMEDLQEMQRQVLRCKAIVNGVLMSAGKSRADQLASTTLLRFMEQVAMRWEQHHDPEHFAFTHALPADVAILSDAALEQMLCNVLDNAYEASPHWVHLHLELEGAQLLLTVQDRGPGFDPAILEHLGKPYQTTKQSRPGRGVGLFLVMNVVRSLDGQLQVRNVPQGGAEVCIRLPLAALTLEETSHGNATPTAAGGG